jgi:hypothetical protein
MMPARSTREIQSALLSAFSSSDDFRGFLLDRFKLRLDRLVPLTQPLSVQMISVLEVAERAGWVNELVSAALSRQPENAVLAEISNPSLFSGTSSASPSLDDLIPGLNAVDLTGSTTSGASPGAPSNSAASRRILKLQDLLLHLPHQVCRFEIVGVTQATGFLVAPDVVLTLGAILTPEPPATKVRCRFDIPSSSGSEDIVVPVADKDWLLDLDVPPTAGMTDPALPQLNYALCRIARPIGAETVPGRSFVRGWISIPAKMPPTPVGSPLFLAQYIRYGPLKLIGNSQAVQGRLGTLLEYRIESGEGAAGAPCFNVKGDLIAVHLYGNPATEQRFGVTSQALRKRLIERDTFHLLGGDAIGAADPSPTTRPSIVALGGILTKKGLAKASNAPASSNPRPAPAKVIHLDDPQKDRWGKRTSRSGRRLRISIQSKSGRHFTFDAIVESTDKSPLEGPVLFYLHDSYPDNVIPIRSIDGRKSATLENISSYGSYTIGAQVKTAKGEWIGLELDLAKTPSVPKRFRD